MRSRAAALALLLAGPAWAGLGPGRPEARLPALQVLDEKGVPGELGALTSGAPTILLPIFARCGLTCPVTVEALKAGLAKARAPFRVVVLSFDATDTPAMLAEFRADHRLPADWAVVRGAEAGATRAFLDRLDFRVMSTPEGAFNHPDATYVLSPKGAWSATFAGPDFPPSDLERAYRDAAAADSPSAARTFTRPEVVVMLVLAALVLCLGVVFATAK